MGFWDEVGSFASDVAPFVVGAAAGYFAGPAVGQEAERGTEVAIHGRPKKPPTYITQNIVQPLYVARGGASSEGGVTILTGGASSGSPVSSGFARGRPMVAAGPDLPAITSSATFTILGVIALLALLYYVIRR